MAFRSAHLRSSAACLALSLVSSVVLAQGQASTPPSQAQGPAPKPDLLTSPAAVEADACAAPALASAARLREVARASKPPRDRRAIVTVDADRIQGRPDKDVQARGDVQLRQGNMLLRTDSLDYDVARDEAKASGNVRIERGGDVFKGQSVQITVSRLEGFVTDPEYFFARTQAGGRAERIDFVDEDRAMLTRADYTSCARDEANGKKPAWLLRSDRVRLDFEANEGIADGAVLEFMGVPILAAPRLRFPLTDARKSGWLPPAINLDNKKGLELGLPYYWDIAPDHDVTIVPTFYSRRGLAAGLEYRYLAPTYEGFALGNWLPNDRVTGTSRHALEWRHRDLDWHGLRLGALVQRTSDDNYWKDFSRHIDSLTPRLLSQDLRADHPLVLGPFAGTAYARVQHWQVLQDSDPLAQIISPYQRSPQLGWRASRPWRAAGANVAVEGEINHFTLPGDDTTTSLLPQGWRAHALASVSRRWSTPGWWFEPGLKVNAASYRTDRPMADGRTSASRLIHTGSVDTGLVFERDAEWFGRPYRQTLEPRLRYVNTPWRDQSLLPNFDAAATDFNVVSIYGDSAFSGIDRVSDAHQITAGATSRWLDAATGEERLRLGAVQKYLLRDQLITPDGVPITQRFSDVLLFGNSNVSSRWTLGGAMQYSSATSRVSRSVLSARYNVGDFRTINLSYRFVREASEQIDVGWQWPLYRAGGGSSAAPRNRGLGGLAGQGNRECNGTLYTVGRVNYSRRDSRVTDSVLGFEYDSGCWIGRVVVERLSTGRAEATQRLLFQLELVGLSRLGSNPLKVLKDNIPGYKLLRDDAAPVKPIPVYE